MQMPHDVFGKLLQVAMNEAEQSQTHRQHENSLCSLANRHRAQPWLNLHGLGVRRRPPAPMCLKLSLRLR